MCVIRNRKYTIMKMRAERQHYTTLHYTTQHYTHKHTHTNLISGSLSNIADVGESVVKADATGQAWLIRGIGLRLVSLLLILPTVPLAAPLEYVTRLTDC